MVKADPNLFSECNKDSGSSVPGEDELIKYPCRRMWREGFPGKP